MVATDVASRGIGMIDANFGTLPSLPLLPLVFPGIALVCLVGCCALHARDFFTSVQILSGLSASTGPRAGSNLGQ